MSDPKTLLEMMEEDGEYVTKPPLKPIGEVAAKIVEEHTTSRKYPILGKLKSHQIRALNEADEKSGHAWFMDPGAGKTLTAIAEAGRLYEADKIDGMIVVAPHGPHKQWLDEQFPLWAGYRWSGIHNKQPEINVIQKFLDARITQMGLLCINYEAVATRPGRALINAFIEKFPRFYFVADESHKIKDITAARTREMLKLALRATYRRVLSGTPVLKGLEDLWSQYEFTEPGLAWPLNPISVNHLGTLNKDGFKGYRINYCKLAPVPGNRWATRIVGYRNEEHLRNQVASHTTRVMADEFMKGETPDMMRVECVMKAKQKREYARMRTDLIADIDGGTITADNALSRLGRLLQIASGFIYHEEDDGWDTYGDNKVSAAMNLIEQLDEPVIVWAPLRALQAQMIECLDEGGFANRVYTRSEVELWKADPQGILIGNQASGLGVGMNLQHAAANIYLANNFSSEARWQSIKRTDRIGQTRQVRIWDLVAPDTVDETVLTSLANKEEISRQTIDQMRNML